MMRYPRCRRGESMLATGQCRALWREWVRYRYLLLKVRNPYKREIPEPYRVWKELVRNLSS